MVARVIWRDLANPENNLAGITRNSEVFDLHNNHMVPLRGTGNELYLTQ